MRPPDSFINPHWPHWLRLAITALLLVYLALRPPKAAPVRESRPPKDPTRRRHP